MAESRPVSSSEAYVPSYPFATAMVVGYSFLMALTAFLFLAVWLSRDALMARPPQIPWTLVLVFSAGTWSFALLQIGLLYRFKDKRFWPQTRKEWLRRTAPVLAMAFAAMLPGFIHAWNTMIAAFAVTMLLGMTIGMVPTLLCFADWLEHRLRRVEEAIKLRQLEKSDLPRAVRSHFDAHTDELNRMGFEQLGDYRLKEHTRMYARFFLNRERDVYAEVCHARIAMIPFRVVCFFSLSPEGCYLESSNSRMGIRRQTRLFELQVLPGSDTREVFEQHQARLRQLDQGRPRLLDRDNLEPVIHYGLKHLYSLLRDDESVVVNPYADFDESVLVPQASPFEKIAAAVFESPPEHDVTVNV